MVAETLYEVLGVSEDASPQQIKEGYRRQAMKWHPDRHPPEQKESATARFKKIAQAYRVLSDPKQRADYHGQLRSEREAAWQAAREKQESAQRERQRQHQQTEQNGETSEDAAALFLEQMLDLASELAAKGYAEQQIFRTLCVLDCPPAVARAVSAHAARKAAERPGAASVGPAPRSTQSPGAERSGQRRASAASISKRVKEASWDEVEPYFVACILGKREDPQLSHTEFQQASARYRRLRWLIVPTALVLSEVGIVLFAPSSSVWHGVFLALPMTLFLYMLIGISLQWSSTWSAFRAEQGKRYYLKKFQRIHEAQQRGGRLPLEMGLHPWLFSFLWLFSRGMYWKGTALIVFGALLGAALERFGGDKIANGVGFGMSGAIGVMGISMYYKSASARIESTWRALGQGGEATAALRKSGGIRLVPVSTGFAIVALLIVAGMMIDEPATSQVIAPPPTSTAGPSLESERSSYDASLLRYEKQYPQINPDSPHYNDTVARRLAARLRIHQEQGLSTSVALDRAIEDAARYGDLR